MPRIPYVTRENAPEDVAELFAKMESRGAQVLNLWKMLANSPATLKPLVRLGHAILTKTSLDPRLREIAIVRAAVINDCEYEKRAHSMWLKELGMSEGQVQAISDWENSGDFGEVERAVLRFTDEATGNVRVTEETLAELSRHLDRQMVMELAVTTAYYGMLARILVPFGVDPEDSSLQDPSQITGRPGPG